MTLDHKCQIFQNLNGAVGEKLQKIIADSSAYYFLNNILKLHM